VTQYRPWRKPAPPPSRPFEGRGWVICYADSGLYITYSVPPLGIDVRKWRETNSGYAYCCLCDETRVFENDRQGHAALRSLQLCDKHQLISGEEALAKQQNKPQ
jgi:hypothetical protein